MKVPKASSSTDGMSELPELAATGAAATGAAAGLLGLSMTPPMSTVYPARINPETMYYI